MRASRQWFSNPGRAILDLLGILLLAAGFLANLGYFSASLNVYDEGIALSNAFLMSIGQSPHLDFYTNYPPGIYILLKASWGVLGESVASGRLVGLVAQILIALGAGRLGGRGAGRAFSWFGAGIALLWLSQLRITPYAWIVALAVAFWAINSLASLSETVGGESRSAPFLRDRDLAGVGSAIVGGALLGCVAALRHDLFVYLSAGLVIVALGTKLSARSSRVVTRWHVLGIIAGVAIVALPIWLPLLRQSGFEIVLRDLVLEQVQHIQPARLLPFTHSSGHVPEQLLWITIVIAIIAPLIAAVLARTSKEPIARTTAMLLGVLSCAVLPQVLGRSEYIHLLFGVAPGLTLYCLVSERVASRGGTRNTILALCAASVLVAPALRLVPQPRVLSQIQLPQFSDRLDGVPARQREWMDKVLKFIDSESKPGDPIFVGNEQHRLVVFNDMSLYYLAQRRGATRYLQFDPGLVTRQDIQQEMIRDLEETKPKVVVLRRHAYKPEPNESRIEGSTVLDDYIAGRYRLVDTAGAYLLMVKSTEPL